MWNIMVIFMWIISVLLLIIYWCWLFFMCKMFLSFSIDVYVILVLKHTDDQWIACTSSSLDSYWCWHIFGWKIFQIFNSAFDYLLMLTIFHVQNVLIILNWCLCDFLVLKHIHQCYTLHLHWSFTDVGHIFMWKMFHPFWISFVFGLICVFWSIVFSGVRNVLVLGAFVCFSFVINLCELLLPFSCELFQYYFWLFIDVDYLSCAKYSYHSRLMFMWFSFTETYRWPINCMYFIFIGHLLMLTYFCV